MYNPGGTNEKFAKEMTPKAQLMMHEHNAEIPGLVGEGKADVMITETMEARRSVSRQTLHRKSLRCPDETGLSET